MLAHLFWLGEHQLEKSRPTSPKTGGVSRVDDRKVLSGIIHLPHYGVWWVDVPTY